jgi:phospholipid/cholesterol/gamma-HCH transport system substrate-binding protein
MRSSRAKGRIAGIVALLAGVIAVAYVLLGGGASDYVVSAQFQNASQLVKGDAVQVAGKPIGTVTGIDLTPDGQAKVAMAITDGLYRPLHRGTEAIVRQASLSGVANRYVDLRLPGAGAPAIPSGGVIEQDHTTTAVDLDQLFNTFDPKTRRALTGFIRGSAGEYRAQGDAANRGLQYLNPSLAASSRLFQELDHDTPLLRDFIVSSSKLVTDLAARRDDLAGLVDHLATTTGAIGRQKEALASAIGQLPPFMRRANTAFVNLRATLDDLQPLVDESKPVARKLRPFLQQLRPLAQDAQPTLRDLVRLIRSPGPANDLVELTRGAVPLKDIAMGPVQATGKERDGAFTASTKALGTATPELAYARPYAPDLTGWFDDFSHSGVYDALGGASRVGLHVSLPATLDGLLGKTSVVRQLGNGQAVSLNQRNRCPGALERGSVWKPTPDFPCDPSQVPLGR